MAGILYLCATPIGNLDDISYRVVKTLSEVDLIAAEDTRHSIKLLNHFDIKTPMSSYHEHNKETKGPYLVKMLLEGKHIALVTDAGTPAISDPGEDLVRLCYEENIQVISLPGASAVITALTLSGLSTRRFCFEGFLPHDKKDRRFILALLKDETRTIILYEAPHRLLKTLKELEDVLGDRAITLCREITKRFETVLRTTIVSAIYEVEQNEPRGEYVLVIAGKEIETVIEESRASWDSYTIPAHYELYIEQGLSPKDAMKAVGKDRGISKRDVYKIIQVDS